MRDNYDDEEIIVDGPETWTRYVIRTDQGGDKPVRVEWATNDDNDDGYPDDTEEAHDTYRFRDLDEALRFTGRTRTGFYGQPVTVTLDGEVLE